MPLVLTEASFFTEKLDTCFPGLEGIDRTYIREGAEAARARFASFIRNGGLDTAHFFSEGKADISDAEREKGEDVLNGTIVSVGVEIRFPNRKVDWLANPTYNGYREFTYHLVRHEDFPLLAKLYRATGDERYTEAFRDYFLSFTDFFTMPIGGSGFATMGWRTLDTAHRLISAWNAAIFAFCSSPVLSDEFLVRFFRSLWENAYRVRYVNTSHNWLISEMAGLSAAAILFPFFRDAREWEEYAMKRLTEEIRAQVYPDHFQFELSTTYQLGVLHGFLAVVANHRRMQAPLPAILAEELPKLYLIYIYLMTPYGDVPGLNDGGRTKTRDACRAALTHFPELGDPYLYFATNGAKGELPAFRSVAMEYSGYTVMRSGWGKRDFYAVLENAPFGFAHQHEDKLQIILYAYGKRMLDDPGTFFYDNSEMRRYILSTASHNTAIVDGMGQNRRQGYRWSREQIAKKAGTRYRFAEDYEIARGIYQEGYGEEKLRVLHERTLLWLKSGLPSLPIPFFIVYDRFTPEDGKTHTFRLHWHLEDVSCTCREGRVDADYGDGISLTLVSDAPFRIVKGQKTPTLLGWHPIVTPGEHEHLPTPTVISEITGRGGCTATILCPSEGILPGRIGISCDTEGVLTVSYEGKRERFSLESLF